jgi:hypothetical protein
LRAFGRQTRSPGGAKNHRRKSSIENGGFFLSPRFSLLTCFYLPDFTPYQSNAGSAWALYGIFALQILRAMKHLLLSLAAILLFADASFAQAKDSADKCKGLNKEVMALVNQYKELRERRRRLPPGEHDKDLSDDGGKLSRVLSSLGAELGHPPHTKQTIVGCLGAPDAVKNHKQMIPLLGVYNRELEKAGRRLERKTNRQYLIYFWRGWHDFLFFISEDGLIMDHGWWFAYE